jgi:hypothetical protein
VEPDDLIAEALKVSIGPRDLENLRWSHQPYRSIHGVLRAPP